MAADAGADRGTSEASTPDQTPSCDNAPQPLDPVVGPSRVVEVHDPLATDGTTHDGARIKGMLIAGIKSLAGHEDIAEAWKLLIPDFAPSMRIGIKLNCLSSYLYSSVPFLISLVDSLVNDLGADAAKILVWDRRGDELTRSKITETVMGTRVFGTVTSTKDDSGPGYLSAAECIINHETRLSRILTDETDITINIPLLKTHGVGRAHRRDEEHLRLHRQPGRLPLGSEPQPARHLSSGHHPQPLPAAHQRGPHRGDPGRYCQTRLTPCPHGCCSPPIPWPWTPTPWP